MGSKQTKFTERKFDNLSPAVTKFINEYVQDYANETKLSSESSWEVCETKLISAEVFLFLTQLSDLNNQRIFQLIKSPTGLYDPRLAQPNYDKYFQTLTFLYSQGFLEKFVKYNPNKFDLDRIYLSREVRTSPKFEIQLMVTIPGKFNSGESWQATYTI